MILPVHEFTFSSLQAIGAAEIELQPAEIVKLDTASAGLYE